MTRFTFISISILFTVFVDDVGTYYVHVTNKMGEVRSKGLLQVIKQGEREEKILPMPLACPLKSFHVDVFQIYMFSILFY